MKCYLCGATTRFYLKKNGYMIYRCDSCGLARTELNQQYDSFLAEQYNKGYFTGDLSRGAYINYKEDKPFIIRNMRKFLAEIKKVKPRGKLLEVGCAMGFFVEIALKAGYDAYGFDPSDYAVDNAVKLNGDTRIKRGNISSVEYPAESFDVIALFDVFEHLGDPRRDLRKLFSLLKKDGIIIIATGDTESTAAKILGRRWTFYIPPQHLFFFNRQTLTTLLNKEDLIPYRWFRIGKWLSLRYVLHLARTTGESRFASWLYDIVKAFKLGMFPLYLSMQDNMVVIAQKKNHA
ncbi:MAG: Methyltransferase type 12 [Candidatus Gottesmanbacteria bacterium GW2011_GWA2_47_9]|uniref:Methyltransferase type 12 n=2 Tax=Microgenomates group TaxID=1794810 RepID=A0A0G1U460_9BACT|nr:MAG: Methyltransferase type 12 [Candidatus Woesebacteria bacterium GW2011_GWA1_43_12]KKU88856.1 MAG: Methyltransferase type 12 [Candidatus Gottesmanbacteria bacterium GW2011_GWA2_47_9]